MNSPAVQDADAIVVGAGLTGSWVAKELTSGGMKVALIDAGPVLSEDTFSMGRRQPGIFDPRYHLFRLKLLLKGERELAFSKFISKKTNEFFLDRRTDPYVTAEGHDFSWFRVRAVGGRGHFWGRVMLRLTDAQLSNPGFEWPIRYADLAPFYSEVEQLLELGGAPSDSPDVPDGEYVHSRSLHPLERQFCEAAIRRWPSRRAVVNHVAQYEPSPLSPMLSAALDTKRLAIFPNSVAAALTTDGPAGAVSGVTTVSSTDGAVRAFRAPIVVLAASAFESVRILLNSRSDRFPNGVGNSNGLVGTRILEHIGASVFGQLPPSLLVENPKYFHNPFKLNDEPHGFYMPPFSPHEGGGTEFRFGYGVQGTISSNTGLLYVAAMGETVPSEVNRLRLDQTRKDRFGVPIASIDFSWSDEDLALWKHSNVALVEMIDEFERDSGIKIRFPATSRLYNLLTANAPPVPSSNHESGGARMGTDPRSSVVDSFNRVWDAPNVLVCDSACFPSIPHQNPTLTTMTLALRASRQLLKNG